MSWMLWLVVGWFVVNILGSIALIGKKREPITPRTVIVASILWIGLIVLVIAGGHAQS